jgi:ATP-dependent helicase HepA
LTGFVTTDNGLGIGKLIGSEDGKTTIRYFRGPTPDPTVKITVPEGEFESVQLSRQTRAYVPLTDGAGWRVGRIDDELSPDDGTYPIAFTKDDGCRLSADEFEIRWSLRVEDPFEFLSTGSVESRELHAQRLSILGGWLQQRSAALGVEGLYESPVLLLDYQLQAVSRVSSDAERRYLLADEVGLGKTIEAGALIRQFLDHHREGRVLVLAPIQLHKQWAEELERCFITSAHDKAWIKIRDLAVPDSWPPDPVDVLVVDEAHHLGRSRGRTGAAYAYLLPIAHQAKEVLLLSATPMRSNEKDYLDLLHLLDPANYELDGFDQFKRRVELRDNLANLHRALTPDLDPFDLEDLQSTFENLYPDDAASIESFRKAAEASDADRPKLVANLKDRLSETYRIHHRLIRTRRSGAATKSLTVRGRKRDDHFVRKLETPSHLAAAKNALLDGFRQHLLEATESGTAETSEVVHAFRDLAERCGSSPRALLSLRNPSNVSDIHPLLQSWIGNNEFPEFDTIEMGLEEVEETTAKYLRDITLAVPSIKKAVIFTMYEEVAQATATSLANLWSEERIARHVASADASSNSDELDRWLHTGDCKVLVCDHSAEEGVNLQFADLLIHLDLPWQVPRLEQRIGRCDRFIEEQLPPITSKVLLVGDQPYAEAWCEFAASACKVFDRSVASLQYVLADIEESVLTRVLQDGPSGIEAEIEPRSEELESELALIDAHDSLDQGTLIDKEAWLRLRRLDDSPEFQKHLVSWFEGVNIKKSTPSPGAIQLRQRHNVRPHIPFDLEQKIRPYLSVTGQLRNLPLTRSKASEMGKSPLRSGHPMVDAIGRHLETTDRATTFAVLCHASQQWPPIPFFRSDFLVRPGSDSSLKKVAKEAGISDWLERILVSNLPATLITVHTDTNGNRVSNDAAPFKVENHNLTYTPDDPGRFDRISTACGNWPDLCRNASANARNQLEDDPKYLMLRESATSNIRRAIEERAERETRRAQAGLSIDGLDLTPLLRAAEEPLALEVSFLGGGVFFLGDRTIALDPPT